MPSGMGKCPLLAGSYDPHCLGPECAWYLGNRCAVLEIAIALARLAFKT